VRAFDDQGDRGEVRQLLTIVQGATSTPGAGISFGQMRLRAGLSALAVPAPGRQFSARLRARPVRGRPGRVVRRGVVQSLRGMLVSGSFNGRLTRVRRPSPAEKLLATLLRARFRARLDASVDAKRRTGTTTMLALATLRQSSKSGPPMLACVRITTAERPGRKPSGNFRVLGGTRAAGRLAARGTFTFRPVRRIPGALAGRVNARLVRAHGLPRACAALASPQAGGRK
jgi:hypothetical protein